MGKKSFIRLKKYIAQLNIFHLLGVGAWVVCFSSGWQSVEVFWESSTQVL